MHRFFVLVPESADLPAGAAEKAPLAAGDIVALSETDSVHAARVLRLAPGDVVVVCDGRGYEYEAELHQVSPRAVTVRIRSGRLSAAEPSVHVTLAQGIAKGDKMDFIVQKAVEVGVSRIIPLSTQRTVVRLDEEKAGARVERWQRIAYEAAKQSGRARVPRVEAVHAWEELWRRRDLGTVFVPWEGETTLRLLEAAAALAASHTPAAPARLTIVIGPEGGFAEAEIALAQRHGAQPVTLGPRILRTETAGLVAAALVLGALGELG